MASFLPVRLVGDNLGRRHHQLNRLVNDAYDQGLQFSSAKDFPEKSPLDRFFKIDLASKYKNVDYIIENLKNDDMLFVSRALKCTWLLDTEYADVIKPSYLEDVLYVEMATTAVMKMKHWIELNLKDIERCKRFYQFYVKKDFDASLKFLRKCSEEFILSEVSKADILEQIDFQNFRLLVEKCPDVAKVFFDQLKSNEKILDKYLNNQVEYYNSLKVLLKLNGDLYLDITEKYFSEYAFTRLSPEATKHIMKNYKERFDKKPELYTAWLLDIKTMAKHLTEEETKDLVMKLARAKYLEYWFSYKRVEPLLKNLNVDERTPFKQLVFVDKAVGDMVEKWPYETPSSPEAKNIGKSVFTDNQHNPYEYTYLEDLSEPHCGGAFKRALKKRKGDWRECCDIICTRKSSLDQLFDRYRFVSFEKTLHDLRKQLNVETLQHRQNIMLVLISKSGGRAESLGQLMNLLTTRHENEPEHLRATVIRSLVRRCGIWRLPENVWDLMLKFGRGVGLDGSSATVACKEGIHAVIIRSILLDQEVSPAVWKAYIKDFSTLNDYSLNVDEKKKISTELPQLLVIAAKNEPTNAVDLLEKALDSLDTYKMRVNQCPDLVKTISETADNNKEAERLLHRLFKARIARKQLFKENFVIIQNNASYSNALKHDISVLSTGEAFEVLITSNKLAHEGFIRNLALYFNEEDDLAPKYLSLLKKHVNDKSLSKHKLARHIVILSGDKLLKFMKEFDGTLKKTDSRRFAAALRANFHLARPMKNLNELDWKYMGVKAVANRVLTCSKKEVELNIQVLLTWRRTQKLALVLSMRVGKEAALLQIIGEKAPRVALKTILQHLKRKKLDEQVWDVILPLIVTLNTTNKINERLREVLSDTELVPANRKAKYCTIVFEVFRNVDRYSEMPILCIIEQILPEVNEEFIETVIKRFLVEEFTIEKLSSKGSSYDVAACLCIRIVAKYLLQCKSDKEQDRKWESLGKPFFDHLEEVWNKGEKKSDLMDYVDDFIMSLKYTKIFLDTDYASCLPMFERIINRLQIILPIHQFFGKYIQLHLTMLYFKSLRQSIKNNPTLFDDLPKNLNQAAEIVGFIFGKLIAREVVELIDKYFESVRDIYKVELNKYVEEYFVYGESKSLMVTSIVRSILQYEDGKTHLLAEYIYDSRGYKWPEKLKDEIYKALVESKNKEVQLIFNANLFPW